MPQISVRREAYYNEKVLFWPCITDESLGMRIDYWLRLIHQQNNSTNRYTPANVLQNRMDNWLGYLDACRFEHNKRILARYKNVQT